MILDAAGARHDAFLLPREDFPFAQRRRSCARQLGWAADGELLAVAVHRCRSLTLWRAASLESWDLEVCHKAMHNPTRCASSSLCCLCWHPKGVFVDPSNVWRGLRTGSCWLNVWWAASLGQ